MGAGPSSGSPVSVAVAEAVTHLGDTHVKIQVYIDLHSIYTILYSSIIHVYTGLYMFTIHVYHVLPVPSEATHDDRRFMSGLVIDDSIQRHDSQKHRIS